MSDKDFQKQTGTDKFMNDLREMLCGESIFPMIATALVAVILWKLYPLVR